MTGFVGLILSLCMLIMVTLSGCSSGFSRQARVAAVVAARDPWTWGPLLAATAVTVTETDERISKWAKTETPVFGTHENADLSSDEFRLYASNSAWAIFLAATPQGQGNWMTEKLMDAAGTSVGLSFARNTTGVLKGVVHRERPHGGPDHGSFPSAHASDAFAHASMGRYFIDRVPIEEPWRFGASTALNAFAIATAWARVEGGVHYPADVMGGAAVANFMTRFFLELNAPGKAGWRVFPRTDDDGGIIIEIEKPL